MSELETTSETPEREGDCPPGTPHPFAVTRYWKDNPNDFQVLEYFSSVDECRAYIAQQRQDPRYQDKISSWE